MIDTSYFSEHLTSALRDTLETMAFAEVLPDENKENADISGEGAFYWGRIGIISEHVVSCELAIPVVLAQELADTMYAGATPENSSVVTDVVAELANTVTGKFFLDMGHEAGSFTLEVPEKGEGLPEIPKGALVCQCIVDELHRVRAVLCLK